MKEEEFLLQDRIQKIQSMNEKYDGLCCDLFDGVKYVPSIEKRNCDKWELGK